jgi:hypothetical protein
LVEAGVAQALDRITLLRRFKKKLTLIGEPLGSKRI